MPRIRVVANGDVTPHAIKAVRRQLQDIGLDIINDARRAAPVKTGRLRSSGDYEISTTGELIVGFKAPYAAAVSETTSTRQGDPFFKQALYKRRVVTP